jgi:MSHA biogenesis protein MshQ
MRLLPGGVDRSRPVEDESARLLDNTPYPVTIIEQTGIIAPRADLDPIMYRYSPDDTVTYAKSPEAVVAPFAPSLTLTIEQVTDQDGVTATGSVPLLLAPTSDAEIYYGRRVMENSYGPENAGQLTMPFAMEYWDGSAFVVNQLDNCTTWNAAASQLEDPQQYHDLLSEGAIGTFDMGQGAPLVLEPNGSRGTERLTWTVPLWQQDDFDGDGTLDMPSALATFGVYRGHDRIIYWQEVLN